MALTQDKIRSGELIGFNKDQVTVLGKLDDMRDASIKMDEIINFRRNLAGTRVKFRNLLPATIFKRSLVDACPTLKSSCADRNSFELEFMETRYINEEFRPQTLHQVSAEEKADYIKQTSESWVIDEVTDLCDFLKSTFPNQAIDATAFPKDPQKELLKYIRQVEAATGVGRQHFTILGSNELADMLLDKKISVKEVYATESTTASALADARATFGVASFKTVPMGQLPKGVLAMIYIKNYVIGGTAYVIPPQWNDLSGDIGVTPGTKRYYVEETYGYDVFNTKAGLVLTMADTFQFEEITVDDNFHKIKQADAAAFDDAAAITAFNPVASTGEDVVVLFNGVKECIKSGAGVASVIFGIKDKPMAHVTKVSVLIVRDDTEEPNGQTGK